MNDCLLEILLTPYIDVNLEENREKNPHGIGVWGIDREQREDVGGGGRGGKTNLLHSRRTSHNQIRRLRFKYLKQKILYNLLNLTNLHLPQFLHNRLRSIRG